MADVIVVDEAPEVVVPLSAMLETPNEPEVIDPEVEVPVEIEKADEVVEQKLADAVVTGASKEEINELRGLLRELRNDNISLKTRLEAAERVQNGEFGKEGADVKPTELAEYQAKLQEASNRDFSQILAVMEVNPKFEDVGTVCTASNFEDIFERVAQFRSGENGTDFSTELVKVKAEVWSLPNPYKYMYETIKEYHPAYAKPATVNTEVAPTKVTAKEVLAKTVKVVTAPATVATMGGNDSETQSGWTASKIDNMPENLLHTVPKAVYNKWLSGELD